MFSGAEGRHPRPLGGRARRAGTGGRTRGRVAAGRVATTRQGVEALFEDIDAARRPFGGRALVEKATLEDAFLLCREPAEEGELTMRHLLAKDVRLVAPYLLG